MIDSEVLTEIGAAHRARIVSAHQRMTLAGADRGMIQRVLTDMLVSGRAGASVDGEALAIRQLQDLGIDVAPGNLRIRPDRTALREAAERYSRDRERLSQAVATILDTDTLEALEMRLGRLGLAEAIESARGTTQEIMARTAEVDGWVRQMDADPCELCRWWWRDGRIWPASHTMPTHKGCACAQQWTRAAEISVRMISTEGQQDSARRAAAGTLDERRTMHEGAYSARAERGKPRGRKAGT